MNVLLSPVLGQSDWLFSLRGCRRHLSRPIACWPHGLNYFSVQEDCIFFKEKKNSEAEKTGCPCPATPSEYLIHACLFLYYFVFRSWCVLPVCALFRISRSSPCECLCSPFVRKTNMSRRRTIVHTLESKYL